MSDVGIPFLIDDGINDKEIATAREHACLRLRNDIYTIIRITSMLPSGDGRVKTLPYKYYQRGHCYEKPENNR